MAPFFKRTPSAQARAKEEKVTQKQDKVDKKEQTKNQLEAQKKLELTHPQARYGPTQVVYADPTFEHPPPLEYSLDNRKKSLVIFVFLIFIDCIVVPLVLYFTLWYLTSLSHNAVFSISTGALGSVSIFEYFIRFRRLWRKNSNCRVIGARRYYLDFFHWNLSIAWLAVMVELIVGTIPSNPPIRLLAMPAPSMLFAFGAQMLILDIMRLSGMRAPFRISSLPAGSPMRPGIYSMIEDVIAVDGSGGTEYRQRLNLRYMASHYFRQMLHRLTLFWAIGALLAASASTAIIFTCGRNVAYVIGWTLPFAWAAVWSLVTYVYVKKSLAHEERIWQEERSKA